MRVVVVTMHRGQQLCLNVPVYMHQNARACVCVCAECEMKLRRAVQLSLVELGGRHLLGKPPQGAVENILQQAFARV